MIIDEIHGALLFLVFALAMALACMGQGRMWSYQMMGVTFD